MRRTNMVLNRGLNAFGVVLLWSAFIVGCGSKHSEPGPVAVVQPAVVEPAVDLAGVKGMVEVHGSPQSPRYEVTFDVTSDGSRGNARIEREEKVWPESLEIQIRGRHYAIQFVTVTPDGFGAISLSNVPKEKGVRFYDERGNHLDQPIENAFRIETEETGEGLSVKVKLPEQARSMRGMTISYYTFSW